MSLTADELQLFVDRLAASDELWRPHVRHDDKERHYAEVWSDEHVNAWVICWSAGHDTGFHDHDDSAAAITVLEGKVREERLRLAGPPDTHVLSAGHTVSVPASAIHRVQHAGDAPAVTIHAYSPPLRRTGVYRVGRAGALERATQHYEQELRPLAEVAG